MNQRAMELLEQHKWTIAARTDRMFAVLFLLQYLAGIAIALVLSPKAWVGGQSSVHVHVWAAVTLGGVIISLPVAMAFLRPGRRSTRHIVAVAQMCFSALLIHLTGGRIETHFHVFGSLAFLGFYRDWRVLISASMVVVVDHFLRGLYWPHSVYGVLYGQQWRWVEHAWWVIFEDFFIILATLKSIREMGEMAEGQARMEEHVLRLEQVETELTKALEVRDTFLSICGHELKTPLTSMRLQAQIASRRADDKAKVLDFAQKIDKQVGRLHRVVEDMLDVSHIQLGKLAVSLDQEVDLGELVHEVAQGVGKVFGDKFQLSVNAERHIIGHWDKFRLEQVLTNLLTNSYKYGDGRPVAVSVTGGEGKAVLKVKDQGVGIAPEDQQKIFQRFERATPDKGISGLGLGLYISRTIVEQHGGKIGVESVPGQGSTFTVELPINF